MDYLSILFVIVAGTTFVNGTLMNKLNDVILNDFYEEIEEHSLSKKQFLDQLVDGIVEHTHLPSYPEDVYFDVQACTTDFNLTACKEILYRNCYDVNELLLAALPGDNDDFNITDAFPTLLYHLYKPQCEQMSDMTLAVDKPSPAQSWGYGIGFGVFVCVISNIGALLGPCMHTAFFQRILLFCVALAVSALASTGFLVLIPEALHLANSSVKDFRLKMVTVMAGIYFFYVTELLMKIGFGDEKQAEDNEKKVEYSEENEKLNNGPVTELNQVSVADSGHGHSHFPSSSKTDLDKKSTKKPVSTVAWMILIGDALHNFVDGISIGAAFTENIPLGVSVSLAIVSEELPHELGDIAILLHAGMSIKRALCYNFLAAVIILIGIVIGILVGSTTQANTWIFAVAGGMFIYIALVDMLPEMREQKAKATESKAESVTSVFIIQNLGLLVGFFIICLLVFFY